VQRRDRFVGILLGLFMMWLVLDQSWGVPAGVEMKEGIHFRICDCRLSWREKTLRATSAGPANGAKLFTKRSVRASTG
jgi:hypothetical protein